MTYSERHAISTLCSLLFQSTLVLKLLSLLLSKVTVGIRQVEKGSKLSNLNSNSSKEMTITLRSLEKVRLLLDYQTGPIQGFKLLGRASLSVSETFLISFWLKSTESLGRKAGLRTLFSAVR
jgi:hypothetical protein